jgi:hypothetical protein
MQWYTCKCLRQSVSTPDFIEQSYRPWKQDYFLKDKKKTIKYWEMA